LPTYFWSGRFRRVPHNFTVPECLPAHLRVLWRCGNAVAIVEFGAGKKLLTPLRLVDDADMPNRNSQKRLSDVRYLMKKVETYAAARDLLRPGQAA